MGRPDKKRERGAALLNLALALGLGIAISGGAFWVASFSLQKARLQDSLVGVEEISSAIFAAYANKVNYTSLTTTSLHGTGLVPDKYWRGTKLALPIGSTEVRGRSVGSGCSTSGYCDNGFQISLEGIDAAECRYLGIQKLGGRHYDTAVWTEEDGFAWLTHAGPDEVSAGCGVGNGRKTVTFMFG